MSDLLREWTSLYILCVAVCCCIHKFRTCVYIFTHFPTSVWYFFVHVSVFKSLCLCNHVSVSVYSCLCACVFMSLCMHIHVSVYVYSCLCVCVFMSLCMCIHVSVYMYSCLCVCVFTDTPIPQITIVWVCFSVLQCVALCCIVLQCVAVRCSAL